MKFNRKIIIYILAIIATIFCIYKVYSLSFSNQIDDYYEYVNKDMLKNITLEENETIWSTVNEYQEEVDAQIDEIAKKLIEDKENKNINYLYNSFLNTNERNKLGIKLIKKYLDNINNSNNINELLNAVYNIEDELKINLLMNIKISNDYKNENQYIVYLYPLTFDFSADTTIYSSVDMGTYEALTQKYMIRLLNEYGVNNSREIANNILSMKREIASKSKKIKDLNDYKGYYNIINENELQNYYSNIDVSKYLKIKGISNQTYSIVDLENYATFNSYLTNENLSLLKNYYTLRILEEYSYFLSDNYSKIYKDFSDELSTIKENNTLEDDAVDIIKMFFSDVLEKEYAKKSMTNEDKDVINNLINEIILYYKNEIKKNEWLSDQTKNKAIIKLENIKRNIGYDDTKEIVSEKYNLKEENSLFDNIIQISRVIYDDNLSYLSNPDREVEAINTYTVNAFYYPNNNSINFPCAAVKFIKKDYYENLGSIGFVVAHEITHAFDNTGSQFDEKGILTDWWTSEDKKEFERLSQEIIDYYSEYKVNGINVDGEITLGENIADLGAIKCISSIARNNGASDKDMKKMYESFAKFAAMKTDKSYMSILMTLDAHSPNSVRVNATLSSTEEFYDVYNINKYDKMYKEDKVGIW